jgi:glycosyltransferase involved in cell wall biosynthesis
VWVASSGGALENEILETGARHLLLPGLGKNASGSDLLGALSDGSRLDELVERERIELMDVIAVKPFLYAAPIRRRRAIPLVLEALSPRHVVPAATRDEIASLFADGNVVAMEPSWGHVYAGYGIDTHTLRVIPNSVDTRLFRPPSPRPRAAARAALGVAPDERLILAVSRLDADKAPYLQRLIDEFAAIRSVDHAARLVIAGNGTDAARLSARAREAHGDFARRIIGSKRIEEIAGWYGAADLFVGMGTTVLEAAACGVPAIVANQHFLTHSQIPDAESAASGVFGQDGYAGIGEPGPRVTSFTERALELLGDPAGAEAVARDALSLVRSRFSMDVVMRQWETFFLERCGREREVVSAPLPRAKRPAVDDAPASPERESHANPNETLIG